jgi:hypothetical protein
LLNNSSIALRRHLQLANLIAANPSQFEPKTHFNSQPESRGNYELYRPDAQKPITYPLYRNFFLPHPQAIFTATIFNAKSIIDNDSETTYVTPIWYLKICRISTTRTTIAPAHKSQRVISDNTKENTFEAVI